MSVNLPDLAPKTGEKGNAVMCNGKASTTCPLPAVLTGPTKSHVHKTLDDKLVPYRKSGDYRQKLPPINEKPKTYELSTNLTIKDLKRQNGNLQLQLVVFKTQSKVMKNVLHRHTVAVQEYQRLEGSLSQIQDQHINEVKAMRKLLGKTRSSCDTLAKKLQESEKELLDSKDKILQLESQIFNNPTMLEKEELSRRLDEATVNLKEKNNRIWELEKNNKLLQSTLHRHIAGEQRKLSKTNDVFFSLQARVYELTREIRERKKELEDHNIPTLRFEHSANKIETFNKIVQTEETIPITSGNAYSFRSGSAEPEDGIQQWLRSTSANHVPGRSLAVRYPKTKRNVEVPKKCTDISDFQEIPIHQMAGDHIESKEVTNASQESMEEELDEDWIRKQKCPGSCRFAQTIVRTPPQQKGHKRTQFRRKYVFSPVTTNLHLGKPAYSGLDQKSRESQTRRQALTWKSEEEDTPPHDYQNSQPDLDPSDSSLVDSFESPQQKEHKLTQFRSKYVFSPVTTNLHLGKPAYSGLDRKSRESLTRRQAPTWKSEEEDTPLHDYQNSQPDLDPSDSSVVDSFETPRGTYSWR